ncbi:TetR family transcriptional regulator [Rahnella sp. BIGb0236]|uniref:TetR/AcrR family transcriptional regulator n=1 Tax=Yersiniaceae TaxID=1903411 RepID=UPI000BB1C3DD|nr:MULTISPECIES: TetR/AcrR family transcriptional regulator [Yersiniaceae]MBX9478812.1 TetR/AcrR family transcriptional regulator [Yersinia enterocolitica]PBI78822.1 TetR family transcriptional regulator [Rahnella victoriana]TDS90196.1 TetR family transcriptional regulator [Rahnella sp. BIGb0236]
MNDDKNSTYHRLIVAAAECFSEKGFNATSIGEIARKAKVSQGAMYTYFKGKSELISAIVLEEKNTALNNYTFSVITPPFDHLLDLVTSCINEVGYPADHRLWVEIIAEAARNPLVKETFIATDCIMRDGIKTIISRGIQAGDFSAELNLEATSIAIFALIDGLISRSAINPAFNLGNDLPAFPSLLKHIIGYQK